MLTPAAITRSQIREIAALYGATPEDMLSKRNPRGLLKARIELAQALRARGYSTLRIGRVMNRDHSTVAFYLDLCTRKPSQLSLERPRRPKSPKPAPPPSTPLEPRPHRQIRYAGWRNPQHDHR